MESRRHWRRYLIIYGVLVPVSIVVLVPYLWMIVTSIKHEHQISAIPPIWIPTPVTLANYRTVLFGTLIPRYFLNSLIVATATALVAVMFGSLAAYAFSRFRFPGRDTLTLFVIFTQMFPLAVLLVPLFIFWRMVGLFDTFWILIVTYLAFGLPLGILLLRSFFASIPDDLDAAAMIDGCSRTGALFRVVLPLSLPAVVATFMYVFLGAWQEYMFALAFITTDWKRTMPIGLSTFVGENSVNWGGMMATATLFTIPVLLLFLTVQGFISRGLTLGSVKG